MSCLFSLPLFKKSCGKTVNKSASRRLCPSPWQFLSSKGPDCHLRTDFCKGTIPKSMPLPLSRTSKGSKGVRQSTDHSFARNCPSGLVSESKRVVGAGGHVVVLGKHQEELGWGSLKHFQKRVCHHYSAVDGPLWKVCLNQQGLGLKKSQNNGVFKMIYFALCICFWSQHIA
jgi:hypothetical protein